MSAESLTSLIAMERLQQITRSMSAQEEAKGKSSMQKTSIKRNLSEIFK